MVLECRSRPGCRLKA
ncbi:hypothetical protein MTR67_030900 [Solanum verrucosum]|uniref:Uncharacterized protein n=1 Tax=Solanum verrucosum TaxID=315347 RepID=A0AAF0U1G6_SOLVR|nr:hypothetical protein MTR67_030900 [Solanum verrucosum]